MHFGDRQAPIDRSTTLVISSGCFENQPCTRSFLSQLHQNNRIIGREKKTKTVAPRKLRISTPRCFESCLVHRIRLSDASLSFGTDFCLTSSRLTRASKRYNRSNESNRLNNYPKLIHSDDNTKNNSDNIPNQSTSTIYRRTA